MEVVLASATYSTPTQNSAYLLQFNVAIVTPRTPRFASAVYSSHPLSDPTNTSLACLHVSHVSDVTSSSMWFLYRR